jgi:hypothetical protein
VPSSPLRVLTWHVHGSYLNYLTQVPVTWLLPVRPDRSDGYGGRGATFTWGDDVLEVPADEVADLDVDLVLTQSRRNWEVDRHELLGDRVRRLPSVHVEHDPPPTWPNDALHPVQDPDALLVHVTPFNALMWDSGATPSTVVDHGVQLPPDVPAWTGEVERAVTVVNNLWGRGRRLGPDVFERVVRDVPVDLAGMNGDRHPTWLGDVPLADLHRRLPEYRVLFNPIRYTSLGLATAVQNGVNGYVDTDPERLVGHLQRLLREPDEAAELSAGARRTARERFGIERFVSDWTAVLERATA